jgi:hypothetical protein
MYEYNFKPTKTIILRVSVIINEPIESYKHIKTYGNHNIQIKNGEYCTTFSQYVAGAEDKEKFISLVRNMYPENYGGYEAIVINMSEKLTSLILKGESL